MDGLKTQSGLWSTGPVITSCRRGATRQNVWTSSVCQPTSASCSGTCVPIACSMSAATEASSRVHFGRTWVTEDVLFPLNPCQRHMRPWSGLWRLMVAGRGGSWRWGRGKGLPGSLFFSQDNFSSFLSPSAYGERQFPALANAGRGEEVTVRRLDDEWPDATSGSESVFLKLYTQGRDLDVLASGSGVLSHVQRLLTEIPVEETYADMVPFSHTVRQLQDLGFSVLGFWPEVRELDLRVIEFNCLLRRNAAR